MPDIKPVGIACQKADRTGWLQRSLTATPGQNPDAAQSLYLASRVIEAGMKFPHGHRRPWWMKQPFFSDTHLLRWWDEP